MTVLGLSPFGRLAGIAPLGLRLVLGVVMVAHGYRKIIVGPARFGDETLAALGVPAPVLMGYVVTVTEVAGGILLLVGLLSRVAACALAIEMVFTIALVKVDVGLITARGAPGAELDLALLAGLLAIALAGPGELSLDRAIGLERRRTLDRPRLDLAAIGHSADGLRTAGRTSPPAPEVVAEPAAAGGLSPSDEPATAEPAAPTATPEGPVPQSDEPEPQLAPAVTDPADVDVDAGAQAEPAASPAPQPAVSAPAAPPPSGASAAQKVRERPGLAIAAGVAMGLLIRSALRRR
jgi:putative oxidoreductase